MQVEDKRKFEVLNFKAGVTDESEAPYGVAGGHGSSASNSYCSRSTTILISPARRGVQGLLRRPADRLLRQPLRGAPLPRAEHRLRPHCPPGSQVGYLALNDYPSPLFNVKPDRGYAAQFVASIVGTRVSVYVNPRPRSEGYGLTLGAVDAPHILIFQNFEARFFGFPQRGDETPSAEAPFLTNPVDCSEKDPEWGVFLDSWETAAQRRPTKPLIAATRTGTTRPRPRRR